MGHTFSSLKTETTKLPILHSETYLAFFTPRDKKPSHSSSVASKDVWLERKWKQKFKGKAEQVLCRYISYYDPPLLFFFYKISEIYKEDIF